MKVKLIVPNCNRETSPVVAYGVAIADIAGGFTATQAIGGWKDRKDDLIVEPVTVFECYVDMDVDQRFAILAKRIAKELHQDCVYLEIDGIVEFIRQ